jgi:hypothetical protein
MASGAPGVAEVTGALSQYMPYILGAVGLAALAAIAIRFSRK